MLVFSHNTFNCNRLTRSKYFLPIMRELIQSTYLNVVIYHFWTEIVNKLRIITAVPGR